MPHFRERKLKKTLYVEFESYDGRKVKRRCPDLLENPKPVKLPVVQQQAQSATSGSTSSMDHELPAPANPPSYQEKKAATWECWRDLLTQFLNVHKEVQAPQLSSQCSVCHTNFQEQEQEVESPEKSLIYRCMDCHPSPEAVLCGTCLESCHRHCKLHKPEVWQDDCYQPHSLVHEFELPGHNTCLKVTRSINVVDKKGRFHTECKCKCKCKCYTDILQYFRMGFWPASPSNPSVLAELDLLHLWHMLTMETQISVLAFFTTLSMSTLGNTERLNVYRPYREGESLHTFRVFALMRDQVFNTPLCYACPKENGTLILSMDGNFGLVHKSNAAKCDVPAMTRHELMEHLFLDQKTVDEIVEKAQSCFKSKGGECSQFQAGDAVRSKNKAANLNYTGVFAISCRHEIIWRMLNMRHGERLSYPVAMLQNIKEKYGSLDLLLLYDIACVLKPHIKKYYPSLIDNIEMAIPIFHCYGHKGSCQLSMNPRRMKGFGMSDGEWTERIWSYMRQFAVITKDQTPGHREDTLTTAAFHLANKKNAILGI